MTSNKPVKQDGLRKVLYNCLLHGVDIEEPVRQWHIKECQKIIDRLHSKMQNAFYNEGRPHRELLQKPPEKGDL